MTLAFSILAGTATAQNETVSSTTAASPSPSEAYSPPPSSYPPPPNGTYQQPPPGSYPPPPCAEGSWWDHQRQACMTGPPPPAPSGQYPPPDGRYPPPQDGYHQPSPQADCWGKMEQARPVMEEFRLSVEAKMRSFQDEFSQARIEFSRSAHSSDEWQAFMESWQEKGKAGFSSPQAEMEAKVRSILGECYDQLGIGGMMQAPPPGFHQPPMMGAPGPMPFVPQFGQGAHVGPAFTDLPPPPMPGGNDPRFRLSEEAEKIRAECEAKVRALMPAPPMNPLMQPGMGPMPPMPDGRMPPPGATYPSGAMTAPSGMLEPRVPPPGGMMLPQGPMMGPPPMDAKLQEQVHAIMRECEQRVRATFQDARHVGPRDGPIDDFKEKFGSLDMFFDEESGKILVQGRFLALKGDPEKQMMQDVTCDGALFIDQLFVNGLLADFRPEETGEGTALNVFDSSHRRILSLHDNPRCVINVAASGEIPSITLDLADHLKVEKAANGDLKFSDGDAEGVLLLHGADADVEDGNQVVIEGRGTFLVHSRGATSVALGGSRYDRAIEDKKLGAEVKIAKGGADGLAVDSVPLGDLEVEVGGGENMVSATIDSAEGTGKTVVLEIDAAVFASDELRLAITGEDNESLQFSEASSLEDVLDPLDDGADGIEYWIVEDKNGFHVLVSFAHFSVKHVTITSVPVNAGAFGVPGFEGLFLVGAVVAAVVVARRRLA